MECVYDSWWKSPRRGRSNASEFSKNFSTVGSFFTCRWQTYLFLLYVWLFFAFARKKYLHDPEATNARSSVAQMFQPQKFRRDAPKKAGSACMDKLIFLLLSDPQLSQKSLLCCSLWKCFFSSFCWMNLRYNNERSSQHKNFTFIKKFAVFAIFVAIFRSLGFRVFQ